MRISDWSSDVCSSDLPCILVLTDVDEAFRSGSHRDSVEETDSRIAEALIQLWDALNDRSNGSQRKAVHTSLWSHTTNAVVTIGVAGSMHLLGPRTRALFAQEYALPAMTAAAAVECAKQAWNDGHPTASQRQQITRSLVGRSITDGLMALSEASRLSSVQGVNAAQEHDCDYTSRSEEHTSELQSLMRIS